VVSAYAQKVTVLQKDRRIEAFTQLRRDPHDCFKDGL